LRGDREPAKLGKILSVDAARHAETLAVIRLPPGHERRSAMTGSRRVIIRCALWAAAAGLAGEVGMAAVPVDLQAMIQEMQSLSPDPDRIGFVWWMPAEFWRQALELDPTASPEQKEELASMLEPYLILGIADGTIGPMGGASFFTEEHVRASVRVRDGAGAVHSPMDKDKVSSDARNWVAMLRPILTGFAGPMGENMHFVFFSGHTAEGRVLADPTAEGSFTVLLGEEEHAFRLPLASMVPKKVCPVDGEELNGTWSFCPWHGVRLEAAQPPPVAPEQPAVPAGAETPAIQAVPPGD
jgi:hypothetical protein